MKTFRASALVLTSVLALASCATQQGTKDVDNFVSRRELCEHMRGELPDPGGDPERLKEVPDGIEKTCTGTDAELKALKVRYADSPAVMAILNSYEPRIEFPPEKPR